LIDARIELATRRIAEAALAKATAKGTVKAATKKPPKKAAAKTAAAKAAASKKAAAQAHPVADPHPTADAPVPKKGSSRRPRPGEISKQHSTLYTDELYGAGDPQEQPTLPAQSSDIIPTFSSAAIPQIFPRQKPSLQPKVLAPIPSHRTVPPAPAPVQQVDRRGVSTQILPQQPNRAPSLAPGRAPSVALSRAPPVAPGRAPSLAPGRAPPVAPSRAPSVAPGHAPSVAPSRAPPVAPGRAPSVAPGRAPPVALSRAPSVAPGRAPSVAPSRAPSLAPGVQPRTHHDRTAPAQALVHRRVIYSSPAEVPESPLVETRPTRPTRAAKGKTNYVELEEDDGTVASDGGSPQQAGCGEDIEEFDDVDDVREHAGGRSPEYRGRGLYNQST